MQLDFGQDFAYTALPEEVANSPDHMGPPSAGETSSSNGISNSAWWMPGTDCLPTDSTQTADSVRQFQVPHPQSRCLQGLCTACGAEGSKPSPCKQTILNWLLLAENVDVQWIFMTLMSQRPDILPQLANGLHCSDHIILHEGQVKSESSHHDTSEDEQELDADLASEGISYDIDQKELENDIHQVQAELDCESQETHVDSTRCETLTIVQFFSATYYCEEGDEFVEAQVCRIGDTRKRTVVPYRTKDNSAQAGRSYVAANSVVTFKPGERLKTIKIDIIDNDFWDTTLTFKIELHQDGLNGAVLDEYLWRTNVKIIDNDIFPTNAVTGAVKTNLPSVHKGHLLKEYCWMCLQNPVVRMGTIKRIGLDILHNLNYLLSLFLNVWLVNSIFNSDPGDASVGSAVDKRLELLMVVLGTILPFGLLHYLEYLSLSFHIGGRTRMALQAGLIRKFFCYSSETRTRAIHSNLVTAVTRDAPALSSDGYQACLSVFKNFGHMFMIVVFKLLAPIVFKKKVRCEALYVMVLFPMVLGAFLYLRKEITTQCLREENDQQDDVVQHVERTATDYDLIAGYGMEEKFSGEFENRLRGLNSSIRTANQVRENNIYFAKWLGVIVQAIYVISGGMSVINGTLSLGMYLATIKIFKGISQDWSEIYRVVLNVESALPALVRITSLLNSETQDAVHGRNIKMNILQGKAILQEDAADGQLHPDELPIYVTELHFEYASVLAKTLNFRGVMRFQQGSLVTIIGPMGQGKSTLLKLVGGSIPLRESQDVKVFVPPYLRRVHVPPDCVLFDGTLLDNLTFGCVSPADADRSRVEKICTKLGIARDVIDMLNSNEKFIWKQMLSHTQRHLLNLARALISNPELLVIHSPIDAFTDSIQVKVLALLREFTGHKGVENYNKFELRRPRTCLMSCNHVQSARLCDQVFLVDATNGIREVPASEVSHALLK